MKKITLNHSKGRYDILIGCGLIKMLPELLKPLALGTKILVVTDRPVSKLYLKPVLKTFRNSGHDVTAFVLPYGDERNKSQRILEAIWKKMAEAGLERGSAIVALGGGVVGDVAAFAASTYMRGISLVQIPTTLLAQVDSAIGGKTAIDLESVKNVVGTFYQPRIVISDVDILKTLPQRELKNAFSEIVKYGVIRDPEIFKILERNLDWFFASFGQKKKRTEIFGFLEDLVWRCARIKAAVVSRDEFETRGERMILNYGHTFGHAFEGASGNRMTHGESVALGMVLAGELAVRLKIFSREDQNRQVALLKHIGLPVCYDRKKFSAAALVSYMKRDKKVKAGQFRLVLPRAIGRVEVTHVPEKVVCKFLSQAGNCHGGNAKT